MIRTKLLPGGVGLGAKNSKPFDSVVHLWEKLINILSMSHAQADDLFILFVYCDPNPVGSNADLVFARIALHLFKATEIEWIT